ncbi:EF-hand domain-containing protein [Sphingomonas sinipercae]|uniref:EF-hand domain-containing protein n=1 Tax=Sphingomonas sinipercae TaxID=2714944 RepID=A0A6G7ZN17_9SPHN|nr:EF-hand domain-containing protein [Sphingomonas sinipercae]QIL02387.1 EF-hand domain-containing protein [Sphingomonas sinipercae]
MWRFLAGAAACFLLMTGAFLMWQSRAESGSQLPAAPPPATVPDQPLLVQQPLRAPEADPKTKEEKRFARADKDKNGRIEMAELLEPRRKAFAKIDKNGDGRLSFEEWAVKTIDKFNGADKDRSRWLTPAEYATTKPPPPKKKRCSC